LLDARKRRKKAVAEKTLSHFDVIIIGAGSVGVPAAMALAGAGLRTLVLDRGASVGQGSNKAAIGGIRASHSDPAKIHISLRSLQIFSTWKECHGDEIDWHQGGYVFVVYREHERKILRELLAVQHSHGLHIDWLDKDSLLEVVQDLNPEGLIGGTYSVHDGSASPLLAVHAFFRRARSLGATFHFGETVTEILVGGGKVKGVRTNKGEYGADVVIDAAGPWAGVVAGTAGVKLPVFPDSHEAAVTEAVARFLEPLVVDLRPGPGSANSYFYQSATGQVMFCFTPSPVILGEDTRETSEFLPIISKRMINLMPRLKNIRVRRTWRGLYPSTPDGFPIVGWARKTRGLLLAVGMGGQGFMLGPGLGELLTRMVTNTLNPSDHEILADLSPQRKFAGHEELE
jgi:sarcosine oxidase subunit beta